VTLTRRFLVVAIACAAPLAAQTPAAGTASFEMSVNLPDSNPAAAMLGSTMHLRMTGMTDGRHVAIIMAPDAAQSMMAGMTVTMVYAIGGDTAHVGIVMPSMAGAGGGTGMRMDLPISAISAEMSQFGAKIDSAARNAIDSLGKLQPIYRDLGTTDTVAGLRCENWEAVGLADTVRTCVVPTPSGLASLMKQLKQTSGLDSLLARIPGITNLQKQAYGGQNMTALRVTSTKSGMRMQLTHFDSAVPDSSTFILPAGLRPMAMPMLPGKPAGGGGTR
jgi:hypothetical protein